MNEHFFIYNGKFFEYDQPVISVDSRGLRNGDGLFETIRLNEGVIVNSGFHFERLFHGMKLLHFDIPQILSEEFLIASVNQLLSRNFISKNARIRIMILRKGETGTEKNFPDYVIETIPLDKPAGWNEKGLKVAICKEIKKSCDQFSNLKSNNALPSVMARLFAEENKLDDAIILNRYNRICESSISNLYIIKDETLFTPPLSEGCIDGTFRRWMKEVLPAANFLLYEKPLYEEDLFRADEVFLTNSIQWIRWVKEIGTKTYANTFTKTIFKKMYEALSGK